MNLNGLTCDYSQPCLSLALGSWGCVLGWFTSHSLSKLCRARAWRNDTGMALAFNVRSRYKDTIRWHPTLTVLWSSPGFDTPDTVFAPGSAQVDTHIYRIHCLRIQFTVVGVVSCLECWRWLFWPHSSLSGNTDLSYTTWLLICIHTGKVKELVEITGDC